MIDYLFMGFVVTCGVLAYTLVGIWHFQTYIKKLGKDGLHWVHVILSTFWWLIVVGYITHILEHTAKGLPIETYEEF